MPHTSETSMLSAIGSTRAVRHEHQGRLSVDLLQDAHSQLTFHRSCVQSKKLGLAARLSND
eukprot:7679870-Heterocapsa_arctica.AAC.1